MAAKKYNIEMILAAKDKASPKLKKVGMAMGAMGAAAIAATVVIMKSWADAGDAIEKMSRRLGVSTTALSEFKHASELSGASLDDVEKGMKKMSKTLVDAEDGMLEYIKAFEMIGLEASELIALEPEKQFIKISEAIADLESPTLRAAAAQDIFGRAGTKLLPMFDAGSEGLRKMRQEAHDLGIVFDEAGAKKAAEFTDNMLRLKRSFTGVFMIIAENLYPVINEMIEQMTSAIVKVREWMEDTEKLYKAQQVLVGGLKFVIRAVIGVVATIDLLVEAYKVAKETTFALVGATEIGAKRILQWWGLAGKGIEELSDKNVKRMGLIGDAVSSMGDKWLAYRDIIQGVTDFELNLGDMAIEKKRETAEEVAQIMLTEEEMVIQGLARGDELVKKYDKEQMARFLSNKEKQRKEIQKNTNAFMIAARIENALIVGIEGTLLSAVDNMGKGWDKFTDGAKKAAAEMADVIKRGMITSAAEWVAAQATQAIAGAIKWIFATVPFPFSIGVAAGAVGAVGAAFHNLQFLEAGGEVTKTGLAVVHKGEVFSGVNNQMGFGGLKITNVFTGNTIINDRAMDDFSEKVGEKIYDQVKMEINN